MVKKIESSPQGYFAGTDQSSPRAVTITDPTRARASSRPKSLEEMDKSKRPTEQGAESPPNASLSSPNSYQIIYIGPETTAMNLERAVLDAGAKNTKSIDRELFYYYTGFGKVDAKGKEIFELGIKARLRKWDEENRSASASRSKSTRNLADYDIEDSQHSSGSDSDEDESDEDDDLDESDLSPEDLPTNVDPTTGEASLGTKQTEEVRKIRKRHKTHKDSVLKAGDHRFKHATPPTKGLKNDSSVKGKTTKATNSPSLFDEIDDEADGDLERIRSQYGEDLQDYDEDEDDEDDDMFGGVGGRDFTQYRGKEDFAFCMGWE